METKANHIVIGAFVLALIGAALGFVYWMGDAGFRSGDRRYTVLFEGSVRGLTTSGDVLFNGIKVGKVLALEIYAADTRKISAVIGIDRNAPVRVNSRASIIQLGLTGLAAVQISPGSPDAALLHGTDAPPFPVIKADIAQNGNFLESAPEVLSNANAVFVRLNDLIANNEDSIRNTIRGAEGFTTMLDANKDEITQIIADAKALSAQFGKLGSLLERADATFARIDDVIAKNEKSIETTVKNVESFTGALSRSETSLEKTVQNVEAFTSVLDANKDNVDRIIADVAQLSGQFKTVASKLETNLDQLSAFLSAEDGSSLLQEAREAITRFRDLARKLDESLGNDIDGIARTAKRGLGEFEQFMREGRQAARTLDDVLRKLDRNPQSLLFGGSGVPEYNPPQ